MFYCSQLNAQPETLTLERMTAKSQSQLEIIHEIVVALSQGRQHLVVS